MIREFYRRPALSPFEIGQKLAKGKAPLSVSISDINTEWCFYVEVTETLNYEETKNLKWLLAETFGPENFSESSFVDDFATVIEVGPRLNFETSASGTTVSICHAWGIKKVIRLETSLRIGISQKISNEEKAELVNLFHDRMTEMEYEAPVESFESNLEPEPITYIPILEQGIEALRAFNRKYGLAMDEEDLKRVYDLFVAEGRNPTDAEVYYIAQIMSEHSRHGFFNGILIVNGKSLGESLMSIVKTPWKENPGNALIAFNSAIIKGERIRSLIPENPYRSSMMVECEIMAHITFTAETHNHPTGIEPFNGGATGPGGGIRDGTLDQSTGKGSSGYCTGNLHLPGFEQPWERNDLPHPDNLASPLDILIEGSNGVSWYQNCFGEPLGGGFFRTIGMWLGKEYRSWFKPVLFTFHTGQKREEHIAKKPIEKGMKVVLIGGPSYRIGMGGSSASSRMQEKETADLDFNSVQRAAPEMEQRVYRVVRSCVFMGTEDIIVAIQDLGAAGFGNAASELVYPLGALIHLREIPVGDRSLSTLEILSNESQERMVLIIQEKDLPLFETICKREKCPMAVVGEISGDGRFRVYDKLDNSYPVDLPLEKLLGKNIPKIFNLEPAEQYLQPLKLPDGLTLFDALARVLRLPSVASKRHLTDKIDMSVGGLLTQRPIVGPNKIPLADCAVKALSFFSDEGEVTSFGEQPIIGLISPQCSVNMAIAEAILNASGTVISNFADIKFLANWMLAAKMPGEGLWLHEAALTLRNTLIEFKQALLGGKDSLTMVTKDDAGNVVKAPRELVLSLIAPVPDVNLSVTPEIKKAGNTLLLIDLAHGKNRLGGSELAQVFEQIGDDCPDLEDKVLFVRAFNAVQELIRQKLVVSVHDRIGDGLVVALLEMAFAGNAGLNISITSKDGFLETLFSKEAGLVIECSNPRKVMNFLVKQDIPVQKVAIATGSIGKYRIKVKHNGKLIMDESMLRLRQMWDETSTAIERLQSNPECVEEEARNIYGLVTPPPYRLTFVPQATPAEILAAEDKPKVAVIRDQGSNSDDEMEAALKAAGFEVWDIIMTDLLSGIINLDDFQGVVFVGGFSYGDVRDAAKAWAGLIRFNPKLKEMFDRFYQREDTFSFGECNGCQLMALLGWIPWRDIPDDKQPRFIRNKSGRFESRFSTVKILKSPAIMLQGMEGSMLGVWMAHGEGRFYAPDYGIIHAISRSKLSPIRFVDMRGEITESYPDNCNGSPYGFVSVCSRDGRHLAFMGHPARTFQLRQWAYFPDEWKNLQASPWLRMFQNAYAWCIENRRKK